MIRTRIVPARLSEAERRIACQGQREAAKAWNLCTQWSHEAWRADDNLSAYDLKKRLVALTGDERPKLHTHSIQECAFDLRDAVATTLENRKQGRDQRMPHREKRYRPVSFTRNFGRYITDQRGVAKLALSFGKGRQRLLLPVPDVPGRWGEIKLYFNGSGYELHIATDLPNTETHETTGRAGAIDPSLTTLRETRLAWALHYFLTSTVLVAEVGSIDASLRYDSEQFNSITITDRTQLADQVSGANQTASVQDRLLVGEGLNSSMLRFINTWGLDLATDRAIKVSDARRRLGLEFQWDSVVLGYLLLATELNSQK